MNEYVLNEIAINEPPGYLQYGDGSASIVISATGDVRVNAQVFATSNAALVISMTGQGKIAALGASAAAISVSAVSESAEVDLGAGAMSFVLSATGVDSSVIGASSAASIVVDGYAIPQVYPCSFGVATIGIGGKYEVPGVQPIPALFHETHRSRAMAASAEQRTIIVPEDPPVIVRETRAARIQQQGRQAS